MWSVLPRVGKKEKLEAVRHIIATIFLAQNALRDLAPEYRWAGLGNLLEDFGELVARERYGLRFRRPDQLGLVFLGFWFCVVWRVIEYGLSPRGMAYFGS